MIVRHATPLDAEALTAIHNDAIVNTTAIWDESPVDVDERIQWLAERQAAGFPVLVADVDGAVGGYSTYGPWRPKSAYRHTVEASVYVLPSCRGLGLASTLVDGSVQHARACGLHRMVAMIESGNQLSIDLHARRGFQIVGQLDQVGRKFDRWLDLTVMQLRLGTAP